MCRVFAGATFLQALVEDGSAGCGGAHNSAPQEYQSGRRLPRSATDEARFSPGAANGLKPFRKSLKYVILKEMSDILKEIQISVRKSMNSLRK